MMTKSKKWRKIIVAILLLMIWLMIQGFLIEPHWIVIKEMKIGEGEHKFRAVHIADLHFTVSESNKKYMKEVFKKIEELKPDYIFITGDWFESMKYKDNAAQVFAEIIESCRIPIYGIPGNHDIWCDLDGDYWDEVLRKTGGRYLRDEVVKLKEGVLLFGAEDQKWNLPKEAPDDIPRVLLVHYPRTPFRHANRLSYDLILAGHTHGGQIRIPLYGAITLPNNTWSYQKGFYQTQIGPLYVNPGIGTFKYPIRLFNRPEITVIDFSPNKERPPFWEKDY